MSVAPPGKSLLPQQFYWDTSVQPGRIWAGVPLTEDPNGLDMVLDTSSVGAMIGATPPGNVPARLWWDSNSGQLFVEYDDGNSKQWVSASSIDASTLEGSFLPLTGGLMTGMLDSATTGQNARFFRNGYGATTPAVSIQFSGSTADNTTYTALDVSAQTVHDDGPLGAQGVIYASLQVNGKSRVDLYPIHALIYTNNLASDLTPPGHSDGSSQHGGIVIQSVKNAPAGGVPTGKHLPEIFTNWWQTINTSNVGSLQGGADVCLEADIVGNGPDDAWKANGEARTCNTTSGSPTLTGISDTASYIVGKSINVSQTGDTYILSRVVSKTANTITMDVNAVATITGAIVGPPGGLRFSFQNVLNVNTPPASGGKPLEWAFGHYQNNQFGGTGVATWGVGFAYYGAYYIAASDYSLGHSTASPYSADSTDRGVAIKLAPGQKIAVDGDGYRGAWISGIADQGVTVVRNGNLTANFWEPSVSGPRIYTPAQIDGQLYLPNNLVVGGTATLAGTVTGDGVTAMLAPYAPKASPVFTGTLTAPVLSGGALNLINASGDDLILLQVAAGHYGRVKYLMGGQSWTAGVLPDASWRITNETAGRIDFSISSNGNATFTGSCAFFNATPPAKPTVTGAKGGNAALASLLTALASYGLITDSST